MVLLCAVSNCSFNACISAERSDISFSKFSGSAWFEGAAAFQGENLH